MNIGKVVSMPENVSKTETTNNKDKSLSITTSKSHDVIDFDPFASNNKVVSSVPEERKLPLHGDTNEALATISNDKDLSMSSSINTSPTRNVESHALQSKVQLTSQMVMENDIKSNADKEIPVLIGQTENRKRKINFKGDEGSQLAQASNVEDAHVVAMEQQSIKEAKLPMPI